jgi:hypothetical protein
MTLYVLQVTIQLFSSLLQIEKGIYFLFLKFFIGDKPKFKG